VTLKKRKHWPRNVGPPNTRTVRASAAMPQLGPGPRSSITDAAKPRATAWSSGPNDVFEIGRIADGDFSLLSPLAKLRVLAHRRRTAYTPNADACGACGLCVVACPEGAITLVRRPAGG